MAKWRSLPHNHVKYHTMMSKYYTMMSSLTCYTTKQNLHLCSNLVSQPETQPTNLAAAIKCAHAMWYWSHQKQMEHNETGRTSARTGPGHNSTPSSIACPGQSMLLSTGCSVDSSCAARSHTTEMHSMRVCEKHTQAPCTPCAPCGAEHTCRNALHIWREQGLPLDDSPTFVL